MNITYSHSRLAQIKASEMVNPVRESIHLDSLRVWVNMLFSNLGHFNQDMTEYDVACRINPEFC